ncbi:MAG TPA: class I SAM-dependent methyltransferase [Acidobacteriota bacterium]|nr:class I SAM-dependent methyltransferase [Acidobacteriota bacterium]
MDAEAMKPYGMSLLDYHQGYMSAAVEIVRDDGLVTLLPASTFFRPAEEYEIERTALELARGSVLDVGAGAGLHSMFLQEKGLKVCAIDMSPEAIQVMRGRGVIDVRRADVMSFAGGRFDSILMMGHGIGMVEDLSGLDQFLAHARALLQPGGQILFTSLDVRATSEPIHLSYQKHNAESGHYIGEIRMRFKYRDVAGPFFTWLHVDPMTLTKHAQKFGWRCEVIRMEEDGNYLARLCLETPQR